MLEALHVPVVDGADMAASTTTATRYRIDSSQSRFMVQAFARGLLSIAGHDPVIAVCGFGGDIRWNGNPGEASLLLLIRADSLAVAGDISQKDRHEMEETMLRDVLETQNYPEIVFMSTDVSGTEQSGGEYHVVISGNLSLHGVTRRCTVNSRVTLDEAKLRGEGEFSLKQSDFDIKEVSALGGALKLKDEVRLFFDIVAQT